MDALTFAIRSDERGRRISVEFSLFVLMQVATEFD